jgi:hypothetical protein
MTASFYANSERTPRPPEPAKNLQYRYDIWPEPPRTKPTPEARNARTKALARTPALQKLLVALAIASIVLIVLTIGMAIGFVLGVSWGVAK